MTVLIPLAAALAIGVLLARALLLRVGRQGSSLFVLGAGAALGLGIDSVLFFAFTAAGIAEAVWLGLAQALFFAAALALNWKQAKPISHTLLPHSLGIKIAAALLAGQMLLMLASFSSISRINPHGSWDAWSVWNLRARYLAGGDATWRHAVSRHIILQHPDYPLLTSSVIAHGWKVSGSMDASVPIAVALTFTLGTVLALVGGLALLRNTTAALCAGAVLLAVPGWLRSGADQYADIPLGLYYLCTFAFLCASRIDGRMALAAGFAASLAAWTKDEGLLFAGATMVATLALLGRRLAWLVLAGALPVLLFVIWFKAGLAPGVEPLFEQGADAIAAKLADPQRYGLIAGHFARELFRLPQLLLIAPFGLVLGLERNRESLACLAIAGLTLVGFFAIYLISPHPLEWHLASSLNRLYLQFLPGFLFACFHMSPLSRRGLKAVVA